MSCPKTSYCIACYEFPTWMRLSTFGKNRALMYIVIVSLQKQKLPLLALESNKKIPFHSKLPNNLPKTFNSEMLYSILEFPCCAISISSWQQRGNVWRFCCGWKRSQWNWGSTSRFCTRRFVCSNMSQSRPITKGRICKNDWFLWNTGNETCGCGWARHLLTVR